jgi:NADPH:quinone reductase-like Zn-dependent oxidoreductase
VGNEVQGFKPGDTVVVSRESLLPPPQPPSHGGGSELTVCRPHSRRNAAIVSIAKGSKQVAVKIAFCLVSEKQPHTIFSHI